MPPYDLYDAGRRARGRRVREVSAHSRFFRLSTMCMITRKPCAGEFENLLRVLVSHHLVGMLVELSQILVFLALVKCRYAWVDLDSTIESISP
jgi:hypothetical protein